MIKQEKKNAWKLKCNKKLESKNTEFQQVFLNIFKVYIKILFLNAILEAVLSSAIHLMFYEWIYYVGEPEHFYYFFKGAPGGINLIISRHRSNPIDIYVLV